MRALLPLLMLLLAACSRDAGNPAPPRVDTPLPIPALTSTLIVPVSTSLDTLTAELERDLPQTLWTIDERVPDCIKGQRLTIKGLGIRGARVTPDIACHIKGGATRGPLTLGGAGDVLTITMPVDAQVNARDAGDRLRGTTATARALAVARVRLAVAPDWTLKARIDLDYRWLQEPGLDVLGTRLKLTGKADPKLAALVRQLEQDLPKKLAALQARDRLEANWAQAFTVVELNKANPQVWLRVAPEAVHVEPWAIEGRTITLPLAVRVTAETIIGHKPEPPTPVPLPAPAAAFGTENVRLQLPVLADYHVLEPVLAKALGKLSAKGLNMADYGRVAVTFGKVTIYPTTGGKVAVGVEMAARATDFGGMAAKGILWLAATPMNTPGSQKVTFSDLEVASRTDSAGFDLLVAISEAPEVRTTIETALTQDFSGDLAKLMAKIEPKLAALPIGKDFILQARITDFQNGQVSAIGQGLFMPVNAELAARLSYRPAAGPAIAGSGNDPPLKRPGVRPQDAR